MMLIASAFIGSAASRLLIAALAATTAALVVYAVTVLLGRREAKVQRQLAGYELPENVAEHVFSGGSGTGPSVLDAPETAVVQQAVAMTSRLAERTGLLAKTEAMLEAADVPLRAAEVLFYGPAFAVIVFLFLAVVSSPIVGLVVGGALLVAPFGFLNFRERQRRLRFERQLPDTLTLLASSLRAGFSLMQGLEAVAQEIADPMRKELQRVFTEVRLGRAIEDALGDAADRMQSNDLRWTVMAIRIQREVGGNLSELLLTVADTMTQRERLRRDVAALTAEGRISAIVLACLPIGLGIMMYVINPTYMGRLFNDTLGNVMLGLAALGMIVGFVWMKKIIDIEI